MFLCLIYECLRCVWYLSDVVKVQIRFVDWSEVKFWLWIHQEWWDWDDSNSSYSPTYGLPSYIQPNVQNVCKMSAQDLRSQSIQANTERHRDYRTVHRLRQVLWPLCLQWFPDQVLHTSYKSISMFGNQNSTRSDPAQHQHTGLWVTDWVYVVGVILCLVPLEP